MKKIFLLSAILLAQIVTFCQTIQGSIHKGASDNQVDITFLPDHNSASGETIYCFNIGIAVDTSYMSGVTPTISTSGNFSGFTMTPAIPHSFIARNEKIYTWVYCGLPGAGMSWSNGTAFSGIRITFTGGADSAKVRLVDFTNYSPSGGDNSNTYFFIITNTHFDETNYSALFYGISGGNGSTTGNYSNGDPYVETNLKINMHSDGNRSTVNIPSVRTSTIKESFSIEGLFPNPARTNPNILVTSAEKNQLLLLITDVNGNIFRRKIVSVFAGENAIPISLDDLPNNLYLIRITDRKLNILKIIKAIKY